PSRDTRPTTLYPPRSRTKGLVQNRASAFGGAIDRDWLGFAFDFDRLELLGADIGDAFEVIANRLRDDQLTTFGRRTKTCGEVDAVADDREVETMLGSHRTIDDFSGVDADANGESAFVFLCVERVDGGDHLDTAFRGANLHVFSGKARH